MKKLYVGNLSWDISTDSLKEIFSEVGTVEDAIVIVDKMSGRSKGFGFVTMSTEEEAQNALETFNGKEVEGRELRVAFAEERQDRGERPRRPMRRNFDNE